MLLLLAITAPAALLFGFAGAVASRSHFPPLSLLGKLYTSVVRGVPDIVFFLFFVIALDQGIELLRQQVLCPDWTAPVRQGNDFIVCPAAKMPLSTAPQWVHEVYNFTLAVVTFAIVFGAFAANVLYGAMNAVPQAQLETAHAYGMSERQTFRRILLPQMWTYALPVRQGNDFIVCPAAKMPLSTAPQWVHEVYNFTLAVVTFAIVFGAFAANVLYGAMNAVPQAQLETAHAYGMSERQTFRRILLPQMWTYALPGLGNLWMILIKATPLLFLLGVRDVVYWARELGASKGAVFDYPHGDWRIWYFLFLLVFYLSFTRVSEIVIERLTRRLARGQATAAGERMRREA